MRRSPPLVIALVPQPGTQAVVAALAGAGFAGLCWRFAPWTLVVVPWAMAWAWRHARVIDRRLRWDGERWWLTEPGRPEELPVHLRVVMDLDGWLLLRATPDGPGFAFRHRFLPLNRRGQGAIWGALRATLFAARQH